MYYSVLLARPVRMLFYNGHSGGLTQSKGSHVLSLKHNHEYLIIDEMWSRVVLEKESDTT